MLNSVISGDPRRPAILFLHGFMGSAEDWEAIVVTLRERFYCVAVDLPGHGASLGLLPESYTMEGTTRFLVDLLDELDLGHAAVAGYSMGGRLALYFALRYPERCAGLFLESASPGLYSAKERATRRQADEEKARRLESEDFDEFLRDWYRQPIFASLAQDKELLRRTVALRRRNEPEELARSLRGMGTGSQPSLWDELPGMRVPALAVAGALDEKYVEISRRAARLSPSMGGAVVPGAGHNVRAEASGVYMSMLRGFLESI